MVEAVIFDLDDTLYCYRDYKVSGFDALADQIEANREVSATEIRSELDRITASQGLLYRGAFDDLAESFGWNQEIVDEFVEIYRTHDPDLSLPEESMNVLNALSERRVQAGVLTEGEQRMQQAKVDALGLEEYVDDIRIVSDKRDRSSWESALSNLNTSPTAACYVGDDPVKDFVVPAELGMKTVWIQNGVRNAQPSQVADSSPSEVDHEIDTLTSLLEVIEYG